MISTRTTTRGRSASWPITTPLLAMLEPTELRLYRSESDVVRLAQGEGYLQVGQNRAMLCCSRRRTRPASSTSRCCASN